MPLATDLAGFGAIGVPVFINPGTGNSNPYPGLTFARSGQDFYKPVSWNFPTTTNTPTPFDKVDRLLLKNTNGSNVKSLQQPLQTAAPYTIDIAFTLSTLYSTGDSAGAGLLIGDGTKLITHFVQGVTTGGIRFVNGRWTNSVTLSTNAVSIGWLGQSNLFFLRLTDDLTNRVYFISANGKDYAQVATEATNTFLTPTQVGFGSYDNTTAGANITSMSVYHFQVSAGLLGDAP